MKVLEALGFIVSLVNGRKCCGRPAFSQGNLEAAAAMGAHNLDLLRRKNTGTPILFLEPSCYSMFVEDYRELKLPDTEAIARRCFLFEQRSGVKTSFRLAGDERSFLFRRSRRTISDGSCPGFSIRVRAVRRPESSWSLPRRRCRSLGSGPV